jgi:hypothetical protein
MSTLLLTVKGGRVLSNEWRPNVLCVYDDKMVFENRGLISKQEAVINYAQVAEVVHHSGVLQSTIEIINTGGAKNIKVEHLSKQLAEEAKNLIEQKAREAHNDAVASAPTSSLDELRKLADLKDRGIVSEQEFEQKKKELLGL